MACGCGGDDEGRPPFPPRPLGLGISHPEDPEDDIDYAKTTYYLLVRNVYRAYRDLGHAKQEAIRKTSEDTKVRIKTVRQIAKMIAREEKKKKESTAKTDQGKPSTPKK